MTEPIAFVVLANGRIEAMLGDQMVGFVEEYPASHRSALGVIRAHYKITMPVLHGTTRPASSVAAARRHLLQWLAGWFDAAGPHCAKLAQAVALQAFNEPAA